MVDDEQRSLHADKGRFKQMKESMLMQTQRLEGERVRRNEETERRNIQLKTCTALKAWQDRKELAKLATKQYFRTFKHDNLSYLTEIGLLRSRFEHSLNHDFLPLFYNQVNIEHQGFDRKEQELKLMLKDATCQETSAHREAIKTEMKRRQDKKDEEERQRKHSADAQARRREHRRCLRERIRIGNVQDKILLLIESAPKLD